MAKVSTAAASHRRKKKVLKQAKGQFGHRSKRYVQAKVSTMRAMAYAYSGRKDRKRSFRRLWNARINAACKELGFTYSRFINGLLKAKVVLDRKVLSELAIHSPGVFKKLVILAGGPVKE